MNDLETELLMDPTSQYCKAYAKALNVTIKKYIADCRTAGIKPKKYLELPFADERRGMRFVD